MNAAIFYISTATASSAGSRATRTSELDWAAYRERYGNIQRLVRILKAAGDEPDRYKLTKQADTVLLFFLFPKDELPRIFERLGYPFTPDTVSKNLAYYDRRTSHGSTLSFVAHAGALASVDLDASWDRYLVALSPVLISRTA